MLPAPPFMTFVPFDVSPLATWTTAADGGSSLIAGDSWFGQEDDGNGYSSLFMPFTGAPGAAFRLSFIAGGADPFIRYGLEVTNSEAITSRAGAVQWDFVTAAGGNQRVRLRGDGTRGFQATDIKLERIN